MLVDLPEPTPDQPDQPPTPSAIATVPVEPTPIPVARAIPVATPSESAESLLTEQPASPIPPEVDPSAPRFQVAVLTPTTTEAVNYLKTIAANDAALSDNMAANWRAELVIKWIGEAVQPFDPQLKKNPDSPDSQALEKIIRQALDEVVILIKRREDLQAERLKLLEARQAARQRLENEIQTTRRDSLARLTGVGT